MNIRIKERVTGPTMDDHAKLVVEDFVADVVSDVQATPDQYDGTPYKVTGELVGGVWFKPASRGGVKAGLIGTVLAPMSRFASKFIKAGFLKLIDQQHVARGVGWSRSRKGK